MCYIITMTDYLTRWQGATILTNFTTTTKLRFIFYNFFTWFSCPNILLSDHGSHFINRTINALTEDFHIQHKRITPYHLQANGIVEVFNKVLEHEITKVYNARNNDWDLKILMILWDYQTTYKWLIGKTPFKLVYGQELVILMEYIAPSLCITTMKRIDDEEVLGEHLTKLLQLEEDRFVVGFHQQVEGSLEGMEWLTHQTKALPVGWNGAALWR